MFYVMNEKPVWLSSPKESVEEVIESLKHQTDVVFCNPNILSIEKFLKDMRHRMGFLLKDGMVLKGGSNPKNFYCRTKELVEPIFKERIIEELKVPLNINPFLLVERDETIDGWSNEIIYATISHDIDKDQKSLRSDLADYEMTAILNGKWVYHTKITRDILTMLKLSHGVTIEEAKSEREYIKILSTEGITLMGLMQ